MIFVLMKAGNIQLEFFNLVESRAKLSDSGTDIGSFLTSRFDKYYFCLSPYYSHFSTKVDFYQRLEEVDEEEGWFAIKIIVVTCNVT
jgi:hypothetical protein